MMSEAKIRLIYKLFENSFNEAHSIIEINYLRGILILLDLILEDTVSEEELTRRLSKDLRARGGISIMTEKKPCCRNCYWCRPSSQPGQKKCIYLRGPLMEFELDDRCDDYSEIPTRASILQSYAEQLELATARLEQKVQQANGLEEGPEKVAALRDAEEYRDRVWGSRFRIVQAARKQMQGAD